MSVCFVLTELMCNMGYARKDIEESLKIQKYDDIHATYLLLGRRTTDVSVMSINLLLCCYLAK